MNAVSLNMATLWFWTLVALIRTRLFMSGGSEGRRSAGQTRQAALRWTPRELNLIRAAVQFEHKDDSLLTTETDVVLQVDDSLICLIPPSSWKRSPTGPPKGGREGGFGFAWAPNFLKGLKKTSVLGWCYWLVVVVLNSHSICLLERVIPVGLLCLWN